MPPKMTSPSSLGNDAGRTQLRNALVDHFHSQPAPSASGYPRWAAPVSAGKRVGKKPSSAPVDDPVALVESVKILSQYSKILSQSCQFPTTARELSSAPPSFPLNLQWFERLAGPVQPITPAASRRIAELLKLHGLCTPNLYQRQEEAAFDLARSMPHFDRDLTAFYLRDKCAHEYELYVAHSQLRLCPAHRLTLLEEFMRPWASAWRNQGLLHVLAVAAVNMPALHDWFPDPGVEDLPVGKDELAAKDGLANLLHHLPHARSESDAVGMLETFIATQRPAARTAQAIARTIDRLAILMRVKSNADHEPGHDLDACLDAFPPLENLDAPDIWARVKPALEQAIPPSILVLADCQCKKKTRVSAPSW